MSATFHVRSCRTPKGTLLRYGVILPDSDVPEMPSTLFIPGLGGSVKNAIPFLTQYADHLGPVYALDTRGFGLNEDLPPHTKPTGYLADLKILLHHLAQSQPQSVPSVLMGLSFGGVLATLFASRHPEQVRRLILLAPALCPHPQRFSFMFRLKSYLGILYQGPYAMVTMPYGIRDITSNCMYHDDPQFQNPLSLPAWYLLWVDILCYKALRQSKTLPMPVTMLVPGQDSICDVEAMRRFYQAIPHPSKQWLLYPQAYHDLTLEPEPIVRQLMVDLAAAQIQWPPTQTPKTEVSVESQLV